MEFIRQIYNRFFKTSDRENERSVVASGIQENHVIFSIDIDSEYNRHINIYIPENIDEKNVLSLAEAYASTLLEIGDTSMQQQLLKSINSVIDKNNFLENLLLDNILSIFVQYSKIRSDPNDPLIEPISVFKNVQ